MKRIALAFVAIVALAGTAFAQMPQARKMGVGLAYQAITVTDNSGSFSFPGLALHIDGIMGDPLCFISSFSVGMPGTIKNVATGATTDISNAFSPRLTMDGIMGLGYNLRFSSMSVLLGAGVAFNSVQLLAKDYYTTDSFMAIMGGIGAVVDVSVALSPMLELFGGIRYENCFMEILSTVATERSVALTPHAGIRFFY